MITWHSICDTVDLTELRVDGREKGIFSVVQSLAGYSYSCEQFSDTRSLSQSRSRARWEDEEDEKKGERERQERVMEGECDESVSVIMKPTIMYN